MTVSRGNPELPDWAGRLIFRRVFTVAAETDRYVRQTRSSSGLMILVAPTDDPSGWMRAGLACQRLFLQATAEGLKLAFLNQAVENLPARAELRSILALGDSRPNLVLRLGRAAPLPFSPRPPPRPSSPPPLAFPAPAHFARTPCAWVVHGLCI